MEVQQARKCGRGRSNHDDFICFSYDFIRFLYDFIRFSYDFIWFLYDLIWFHMILYCFHMIFGGGTSFFGCPIFLNFERSTGNSNVRPEIPTTTEFFGCPIFLNFERSTGIHVFFIVFI